MKPTHCMNPNCIKVFEPTDRTPRGLCLACHRWFVRAVQRKETTWRKLEKAGICLPAYHIGRKDKYRTALVQAQEQTP